MAIGYRTFLTSDRFSAPEVHTQNLNYSGTVGNITSTPTSTTNTFTTFTGLTTGSGGNGGTVTGAILSCTMGADNTNPLSISVQVTNTRTGLTLFSTVPSIAKAAGNVFATTANGTSTGVVTAVLQNTAVKAGDVLKAVWTLTRTASPQTEIIDANFSLVVSELQDFNPATS